MNYKKMLKWIIIFTVLTISFTFVYFWHRVDFCLNGKYSFEQNELLFLLLKSPSYEDFLSKIKGANIKYSNDKKQESVYFTNGGAEFQNGNIRKWLWTSKKWEMFAVQGEEIDKLLDKKSTPMDAIQKIGIPNVVVFETDTTTMTYIFVRDEKCKRHDGYYNSSINLKFYKNQFQSFDFNVVTDLNQKDVIEIFILQ